MNAYKTVLVIGFLLCLIASAILALDNGQDETAWDKAKLAKIINSPSTKKAIADQIDGIPSVIFDMDTLAYDPFRDHIIVVTLDFEHTPSGKHGTAAIAYKWKKSEFERIYSSYFLWGTAVSENITADTTWNAAGSPYYLTDNTTVELGATLTIETGTVVRARKFNNKIIDLEVRGVLNCQGATFTSSCDFEQYDNSQVDRNDNDWTGIDFYGTGTGTIQDSVIEYALYGVDIYADGGVVLTGNTISRCYWGANLSEMSPPGSPNTVDDNDFIDCYEAITCNNQTAATTISNNTFTSASKWGAWVGIHCDTSSSPTITSNNINGKFFNGIRLRYSCSPQISSNTIQNNNYGIFSSNNSNPLIFNNNIQGNSGWGLYNSDSMITLMAENNWWGDATGPYHWSLNPGGLGDAVTDYVDFDPWLVNPVTIPLTYR
jgi:parallel beta-helix repeat protein